MKIVIVGIGETATLAYEYFTYDSNHDVVAFAVDKQYMDRTTYLGLDVVELSRLPQLYPPSDYNLFVAFGSGELNYQRSKMYDYLKTLGYTFASYVSSKAFVWHDVVIGENCFILENNTLQLGVVVGNNVTLWSGNHIGHRTKIGDHCFITSGIVISGFCEIGDHTFIGVNASVADNVKVASDNLIGMATVINRSTKPNSMYLGNPAKKMEVSSKEFACL